MLAHYGYKPEMEQELPESMLSEYRRPDPSLEYPQSRAP